MRQGGLILVAGHVRSKKKPKKKTKFRRIQIHHGIQSSPATATSSRRCATKHIPRVSPYSSTFIDSGHVEIGLVQLSQSVLVERQMRQGGPILAAGRVRSKKKQNREKKPKKIPPHPKHTTKSTAARRPRPPRDGA